MNVDCGSAQTLKIKRLFGKIGAESGFTLMEVLIAIAILSFGLLAIASMQIAAVQTNGKAVARTQLKAHAANKSVSLSTLHLPVGIYLLTQRSVGAPYLYHRKIVIK